MELGCGVSNGNLQNLMISAPGGLLFSNLTQGSLSAYMEARCSDAEGDSRQLGQGIEASEKGSKGRGQTGLARALRGVMG